jgi:hypothetical protein
MALRALCFLALLLPAACQDGAGEAATANEATDVTNGYLAENLSIDLSRRVIETVDLGDRWRVSYQYAEGGTGGPIVFIVNKRSGQIVHMEMEQ